MPATLRDMTLRADVLITLLAAVGAFLYLHHLRRRPQRSLLELRMRLLVGTVGVLCALRAFAWVWPHEQAIQIVAFIPATLLPLAMTLFVEGLIRRHVPLGVKLFGVLIGVVALAVDLLRPLAGPAITNAVLGASFAVGLLIHMAVLGVVLLRRDRRSLSRAENGLVDAVLWTTAFAVPLAASDFRPALGWPPNRMGGLAVLIFLVTVLRPARARARRTHWTREIARLVLAALLAVAVFGFLGVTPHGTEIVHWVSVALALVLLAALAQRIRELRAGERSRGLVEWLAEPVPRSFEHFRRTLRRLPLTADAQLLTADELAEYDVGIVGRELTAGPLVRSHGALAARAARTADRGAEELLDLLERRHMTHVAAIRDDPLLLLLVASPELAGAGEAEGEIVLVVRRAQHVLALERLAAVAGTEAIHAG